MKVPNSKSHQTRIHFSLIVVPLLLCIGGSCQQPETSPDLVRDFKASQYFWQQLEIAQKMVVLKDATVLKDIEPNLRADDRHLRGNAAFVFAGLGDERGFRVIYAILRDRSSSRSEGQGVPAAPWGVTAQIKADRYYAVHLLGTLKSSRSIPILVQLLKDPDINYKVAWALGETGNRAAMPPLLDALDDRNPDMRVAAIEALVNLQATDALPKLHLLLQDNERVHTGSLGTVSQSAQGAIATLSRRQRR